MPWPVQVMIAFLLGYPLIQLVAAIFAKPRRQRLAQLVSDLKADPSYTPDDLKILDWSASTDRPSLILSLVFPVIAPIVVLVAAWELMRADKNITEQSIAQSADSDFRRLAELHRKGSSQSAIWNDERFIKARNLSTEVEMMRLPLTVIFSAITALLVLPVAAVAFGWNVSLPIREFLSELTRRALLAVHFGVESIGSTRI